MKKFCVFMALLISLVTFCFGESGPLKPRITLNEIYEFKTSLPPIIPTTYTFQEPPQQTNSFEQSWFYDFKAKESSAVGVVKLSELSRQGKYIADIVAFTGIGTNPLAGFALTGQVSLADQLSLFGGIGGIFRQGEIPQFGGVLVGLRYSEKIRT